MLQFAGALPASCYLQQLQLPLLARVTHSRDADGTGVSHI
jgi:hypothetical protein